MRLNVQHEKQVSYLKVTISVVDPEDFPYTTVFNWINVAPTLDGSYSAISETFPLTKEGIEKSKKWVNKIINDLKTKLTEWRNFQTPSNYQIIV